jgi:hypothetical protein
MLFTKLNSMARWNWKHPWLWLISISVLANGLLWCLVLVVFPKNTPVAILHYSIGVGIDFIGQGEKIVVLPVIGLLTLIGNIILSILIRPISTRVSWILIACLPFIQLILLAAFFLIWQLNI